MSISLLKEWKFVIIDQDNDIEEIFAKHCFQYLPGFVVFVVLFAISVVSNVFFAYNLWYGLKLDDHSKYKNK